MRNNSERAISGATSRLLQSSLLPSVAIGIPSNDYWMADFGVALAMLCAKARAVTSKLHVMNRKSSRTAENRNHIARAALEAQADYLLFLDSDMIFPADTLALLLAHGKDIAGGTYVKRVPPHTVLGVPLDGAPNTYASGCVEVKGIPTGCMLIKTSVLKTLPEPWFMEPPIEVEGRKELMGEDYFFCSTAGNAGFKVYLDVTLSHALLHIGQAVYQIPPVE